MRAWFNLSQDPAGRISFDAEEARARGVTLSTFTRWENGRVLPSVGDHFLSPRVS